MIALKTPVGIYAEGRLLHRSAISFQLSADAAGVVMTVDGYPYGCRNYEDLLHLFQNHGFLILDANGRNYGVTGTVKARLTDVLPEFREKAGEIAKLWPDYSAMLARILAGETVTVPNEAIGHKLVDALIARQLPYSMITQGGKTAVCIDAWYLVPNQDLPQYGLRAKQRYLIIEEAGRGLRVAGAQNKPVDVPNTIRQANCQVVR